MTRETRRRLMYEAVRRHARGESQRQIARTLGIARRTVAKLLAEHAQRRARGDDALARALPQPRAPRTSKLDRFADQIGKLLTDYDDITAQRVYEILKDDGFDGGYTIVREYVRSHRPKAPRRTFDPVSTAPGQQAQVDWSPYTLRGCGLDVNSFSMTLHYSSYMYVDFTRDRRQPTLFRQFAAAFEDLGGVPSEVVIDSEKTMVARWELDEPVLNLAFLDLATYYDFSVHVAPRGDGAYKGGVERSHLIVEKNFLNGRTFVDLQDARRRLALWRDRFCAERPHRTKKKRTRLEMFHAERSELQPLPTRPYDTSEIAWRIVDGFHRVAFETNTYSVPRHYIGQRVCVRATEDAVHVHDGAARLLASHERAPREAHEDRVLQAHKRRRRIDIDKVVERFELWGKDSAAFAAKVRHSRHQTGRELSRILTLQARYSVASILAALRHAMDHGAFNARAVQRILEVTAAPLSASDIVVERIRGEIRHALRKAPVRQRSMAAYQEILAGGGGDDAKEGDDGRPTDDAGGGD